MQINTDPLRNKQRIYIGGNRGVNEVFGLAKEVLAKVGKPVDFYALGDEANFTDAPVVMIKGGEGLENGSAIFRKLDIHILLIHNVIDELPTDYTSFNQFVSEFEKLADDLPKAGTYLYSTDDNVATMIGKKEREDVTPIEYSALNGEKSGNGFLVKHKDEKFSFTSADPHFLSHAGAVKALLKRIGVSNAQFYAALKSLA